MSSKKETKKKQPLIEKDDFTSINHEQLTANIPDYGGNSQEKKLLNYVRDSE